MKKNLMGVAAAVLAMSMSMPAFAHEVTVKGGTNNTPEPTVEHEENLHGFNDVDKKDNATVNKAVDKNAVVGVGNNKLEGDEIITIEDLAVMLWSMEGSPVTPGKIAPAAVNSSVYAKQAVKWAVAQNIIGETEDPLRNATVADVKAMLAAYGLDMSEVVGSPTEATRMRALELIAEAEMREGIVVYDDWEKSYVLDNNSGEGEDGGDITL